jgi:type I restriction-modification system DNA methylase subunit
MPATFEEAFAATKKLVADFRANEANFLSPAYQEQDARTDFINKFFSALGWDVCHDLQKNPFQQEVKLERGVAMGASERRADYAFYVAPHFRKDNVRFFVEAKKPAGEIATPDNCFQTIRYGANAGTPLAVLTSFRQLAVLDSRYKPDIETATKRVVLSYDYSEYAKEAKFREIFHLLSREAVAGGALEAFAESLPTKRGKAVPGGTGALVIGDAFLQELDAWRGTLARAFKNRNPGLDGETLTEITQRTLDRLVFLRFLEDKLIETRETVASLGRRGSARQDFVAASRRLNGIYNGIVFRYHDRLDGPDFQVDDSVFADVCQWLSDPHSSYDFDKIPIHILGSIYERFLGKVIVTTDKRARVEEKPEVRKAGGVYYTPEYIVRYIVENTVGKLIKGKTPARIAEMRFGDIACGSGSFLLGMFDLLLHYHRDWFNANPDKAKKAGCVLRDDGAWHLSLKQRREILLNNIYGVDIDHQAVEVAQLSLYLKLLEEETTASAHDYQLEFRETVLPSLSKNMVRGNSLVGTDFSPHLEEQRLVNAMDFEQRFPDIMNRGGFDAIVGNPPYIRMEEFKPIKDYLRGHYQAHSDRADIFFYFIERAIGKISGKGTLGYIVSNTFTRSRSGESLRAYLERTLNVHTIVEFGDFTPFAGAEVYPLILIGNKSSSQQNTFDFVLQTCDPNKNPDKYFNNVLPLERGCLANESWVFEETRTRKLRARLLEEFPPLSEKYGAVRMGIKSGLNEAFIITDEQRAKIIKENPKAKDIIKPYVGGEDLDDWCHQWQNKWMIYIPHGFKISKFPAVRKHLEPFREALEGRATEQNWYELQQPQEAYADLLGKPKIVYPDMSRYPKFSLDTRGMYFSNTVYFIASDSLFLLGLLNSSLLWFVIRGLSNALRGGLWRFRLFSGHVEKLPVRTIDFSKPADRSRHDKMVALVEQMLAAKKQLAAAQSDADKDFYGNKCAGLDRQIDALVYELYGLTADEIKIVEGAAV